MPDDPFHLADEFYLDKVPDQGTGLDFIRAFAPDIYLAVAIIATVADDPDVRRADPVGTAVLGGACRYLGPLMARIVGPEDNRRLIRQTAQAVKDRMGYAPKPEGGEQGQ
jgi:hypothetical protein